MRRLVLILIALVAVFTFIRAYTDETQARQAVEGTVITESEV